MGLPELSIKIIFYLLIAGIIGWIVGFLLGRIFGSANATELLNEGESRMRLQAEEMKGLRSDLTAANAKIGSLETEMALLTTTLKTRDDWINEMEAKQKEFQDDLDARISELDELKAETDQEKARLQTYLEKATAEAKTEIETLKVRVAEAEGAAKMFKQAEAELVSLRINFAAKERELAQALFRLKNLEPFAEQGKAHEAQWREWEAKYVALGREKDSEIARLKVHLTELEMMAREIKEPPAKVSPTAVMPPNPIERDDLKQ